VREGATLSSRTPDLFDRARSATRAVAPEATPAQAAR
jgi:hypothetical protein